MWHRKGINQRKHDSTFPIKFQHPLNLFGSNNWDQSLVTGSAKELHRKELSAKEAVRWSTANKTPLITSHRGTNTHTHTHTHTHTQVQSKGTCWHNTHLQMMLTGISAQLIHSHKMSEQSYPSLVSSHVLSLFTVIYSRIHVQVSRWELRRLYYYGQMNVCGWPPKSYSIHWMRSPHLQ